MTRASNCPKSEDAIRAKDLLQRRYAELISYRFEALKRFRATQYGSPGKLPVYMAWPEFWWSFMPRAPEAAVHKMGPLCIGEVSPAFAIAAATLRTRPGARILDVGCGNGRLRDYLSWSGLDGFVYEGVDIGQVSVDFPVYERISDIPSGEQYDLIMFSEVIEHMTVERFVDDYLLTLPLILSPAGVVIIGVPNPLAPAVLERDVTHVQHYPWYDLYALLRFIFDDVTPMRTFSVRSLRRIATLPIRYMICYALECDWCEGILMVARQLRTSREHPYA